MKEFDKSDMKRDLTLDMMKGLAIIAMIAGHFVGGACYSCYKIIYSFHMPLFFIIAGFLHKKIEISRATLVKDFKRLVLPYLVVGGIIIIGFTIVDCIQSSANIVYWLKAVCWGSASQRHQSPLFGDFPSIGAVWFLLALFWCKLFFNIIGLISSRLSIMILISIVISLVCSFIDEHLINLPLAILPGGASVIFYVTGYSLRRFDVFKKITLKWAAFLMIVWLAATFISPEPLQLSRCHFPIYPLSIVGGIAATLLIYYCSKRFLYFFPSPATIFVWLGEVSLLILCLHQFDLVFFPRKIFGFSAFISSTIIDFTYCVLATILLSQFSHVRELFKIKKFEIHLSK